jgi:hypothetical protein
VSTNQIRPGFSVTMAVADPGGNAIAHGELKVAMALIAKGAPAGARSDVPTLSPDEFAASDIFVPLELLFVLAAVPQAASIMHRPYRPTRIFTASSPFFIG